MAANNKDLNLALGTMYNEIQRIMFNLEIRRRRIISFSRNSEENVIYLKRIIRYLTESKQYVDAKRETRNLVETIYEIMSMNIVVKRLSTVLALLKEKLKDPRSFNSILMTFLKKADKAIRGNDLKEMDLRLKKLKRYLQPEVVEDDVSDLKEFLDASKENEVNRIYNEIYEEVNLVQTFAGLSKKPTMEPAVPIPEFKPSIKKKMIR